MISYETSADLAEILILLPSQIHLKPRKKPAKLLKNSTISWASNKRSNYKLLNFESNECRLNKLVWIKLLDDAQIS